MSEQEFSREVGRRIRAIRKKQRLRQDELGERAGLAGNSISRIEKGYTTPSILTLSKVAKALNVAPEVFFDDPKAAARIAKRNAQFGEPEIRLEAPPEEGPLTKDSAAHRNFRLGVEARPEKVRALFGEFRQGHLTLDQLEEGVLEILKVGV